MADGGASLFYYIAASAVAVGAAYTSYEQGRQTELEYKERAEEAKTEARDREIQRNNKLLRALASRNVEAGASGTALEGSPLAAINAEFAEHALDNITGEAMTQARVRSLKRAGKSARRIGTVNAAASLFAAAGSAYSGASAASAAGSSSAATTGTSKLGRISATR